MNKDQKQEKWNKLNDEIIELYSTSKYREAIPIGKEARQLAANIWGPTHPKVATSCNNLALLYESDNNLEEAEPLYLEAIDIDRKSLPQNHPYLATHLNNLALLYKAQNRLAEAEPLYLEAIDIDRKSLPQNHPSLASHLNNLAGLLAKTDRPLAAFKLMLRASKIDEINIQRYFGSSSEGDRLTYLDSIRHRFDHFLSLVYKHLPQHNAAKQAALNLVLKRKALTAAAQTALNSAVLEGRYPDLQETLKQWRELSDELLQLSYKVPGPQEIASQRVELARTQKQYNELEQELAREVPEIKWQEQNSDRKAVASSLPAGASLVEFVRFDVVDFQQGHWQAPRYVAFILPSGKPSQVEMVDLGDAAEIDNLIAQYRQALLTCDTSFNMGGPADSQSVPKLHLYNQEAGRQLREAVFDKLRPFLGSSRNLFFAPDGDLNLAPLGILPLEWGDRILRDEYAIHFVSSGQELLRNSLKVGREPGPSLTVGVPNYDLRVGDSDTVGASLVNIPFRQLPETEDLAVAIAAQLGAKALLGDAALVGELLTRRSPKVLLVATHGFFFQEQRRQDYYKLIGALLRCPNGEEGNILEEHKHLLDKELLEVMTEVATRLTDKKTASLLRQFVKLLQPKINEPAAPSSAVERLDATVEDPMLRAGIALAGANTWSWGGKLPSDAGTGILFAPDVAALDLMATELVILVACQSDLGDLASGEGVFGLRRAVAVAGAKNLIMSLWSVPAYAAILLLERLFDNIDAGWQPAEALDMAQDYLKNLTVGELRQSEWGEKILEEFDINGKHPEEMKPLEHPCYWGAWVCQGAVH